VGEDRRIPGSQMSSPLSQGREAITSGPTDPRTSNSGVSARLQSASRDATTAGTEADGSLLQIAVLVLQHRRALALVPLICSLTTIGVALVLPKKYTTTVSFAPVASTMAAGIGGLASQLGVSLPSIDASQSPDFYAELLATPDILREVALTQYNVAVGVDTLRGTLVDLYDIHEGDPGRTLAEAIRTLNTKILDVSFNRQTSIVSVDIKTKWRDLSYQVAGRLLELVNEFNLNRLQLQAGQERRFLGERVDTARAELRRAEAVLQGFLERNRSYPNSPALVFEHDRLQREAVMRQEVYSMLTQGYEQARMQAVRNTPSISLIQHPAPALRYDRRHIALKSLGGLLGGFLLTFLVLLGGEAAREQRARAPQGFDRLSSLWASTRNEIGRLVPPLRRRRG